MPRIIYALAGALVLASATPAFTQSAPLPVAPILAPADNVSILRAGTPIALSLREELTTKGKKLRVGHRFQMEVSEDVVLNGHVIIPAGSPATGEVTDVRNKGMWGKSGHISARVLFVRVHGRQVRLSGQFDDKGVTGTAGVVAALAVVPIAGFFVTGTSAKIAVGSAIPAFIDEDVPVAIAAQAPEPLVIPAVTPAPVLLTPAAPVTAPAPLPAVVPAALPAPQSK